MEYHDKNGAILQAGDFIRWPDGRVDEVALTTAGELATDATNPAWIRAGLADPFDYGCYPLNREDMAEIVKVAPPQ